MIFVNQKRKTYLIFLRTRSSFHYLFETFLYKYNYAGNWV